MKAFDLALYQMARLIFTDFNIWINQCDPHIINIGIRIAIKWRFE